MNVSTSGWKTPEAVAELAEGTLGQPPEAEAGASPAQGSRPTSSAAGLPGMTTVVQSPLFGGCLWPGGGGPAAIPASGREGTEPPRDSLCPLPATQNPWLSHRPPKGKDWPQAGKLEPDGGGVEGAGPTGPPPPSPMATARLLRAAPSDHQHE